MKLPALSVALAISALCVLWTGCGRSSEHAHGQDPAGQAAGEAGVSRRGTAEPVGTAAAPREVRVEVGDHMRFGFTRIEAAAGEVLRVLLVHRGSSPKEAMGHNWVLLRSGVDATAFANAAVRARATEYLPPDRAADVLAATKLIGGGGRDAVVFTVPEDAAPDTELVYLCTFPAHLQLGMRGVLVVR
jgi:azurin